MKETVDAYVVALESKAPGSGDAWTRNLEETLAAFSYGDWGMFLGAYKYFSTRIRSTAALAYAA